MDREKQRADGTDPNGGGQWDVSGGWWKETSQRDLKVGNRKTEEFQTAPEKNREITTIQRLGQVPAKSFPRRWGGKKQNLASRDKNFTTAEQDGQPLVQKIGGGPSREGKVFWGRGDLVSTSLGIVKNGESFNEDKKVQGKKKKN